MFKGSYSALIISLPSGLSFSSVDCIKECIGNATNRSPLPFLLSIFSYCFAFLQGLTIIAFNNGDFNSKTLREVLSLGPTYFVMKFLESMYLLTFQAYSIVLYDKSNLLLYVLAVDIFK